MSRLMHEVPATVVLITALAATIGCAAPQEEVAPEAPATEADAPEPPTEASSLSDVGAWDCEDGTRVVTENLASGAIVAFLPEETVELPQVVSASGAKYSDGELTLWTKGDELSLDSASGRSVRCSLNRRASRLETSKLAGFDLWAIGNEPGWTLEIGAPGIVWTTDYGSTTHRAELPRPTIEGAERRTTYATEIAGEALTIVLEGRDCQDDMSGEAFPTRVTIEFEGRILRGCGQALH